MIYSVAASAAALFGVDWYLNPSYPTLDPAQVQAIEIHLFAEKYLNPKTGQEASTVVINEPEPIRKLLTVFAGAQRGSEHKALRTGAVVICLKDGDREEMSILPGYNDDRYEYRYGGRINYIDRDQFLAALESAGILNIALVSHQ